MQNEIVNNLKVDARRLQNYIFNQSFYMIIAKYDKKRERMIIIYSRYKKTTRDIRNVDEKNVRKRLTTTSIINCKYNIIIAYKKQLR